MKTRAALVLTVLTAACGSSKNDGTAMKPAPGDASVDGQAALPAAPFANGSPWPKFRGDLAQDGASAVHVPTATNPATGPSAPWTFPTGKGVFSSPIVGADGTIYVGSADRSFYALNPDGSLKWKVETGDIIDSSGLLDDKGLVYFGSGDGQLRAVDAQTGSVAWSFTADAPATNSAFINWFEGNVALGPSGTLYMGNDNFFFYALDRDTHMPAWRFKMPDQTWSLPAINPATEMLFVGNNNLLPALGKNTFGIDKTGQPEWAAATLGTIAASPMLTPDGKVVVGGFDGYLRAYDEMGNALWQFAARDHLYASPARLPDGTVVQAGTDGTIYGLDPATGDVTWTYDVREPVRGSPAVDADGHVYVGLGEGRLLVLNADGSLRWSMLLIDGDRDDLNASPALGPNGIYLAGESGEVFGVPYDYCLGAMGKADSRCAPAPALPGDGASLLYTTQFGALVPAPASIDANVPVTFSFLLKTNGARQLAILDPSTITVTTTPSVPVDVTASGDGKFFTVAPKPELTAGADGTVTIAVSAGYLVNLDRAGLALSGGTPGGTVTASVKVALNPKGNDVVTPGVPTAAGGPQATWSISRLSVPLPTVMPSYNQIGFDQLTYLVGLVEGSAGHGVAWMTGALVDANGNTAVDPKSQAIFPLSVANDGGVTTFTAAGGLVVDVTNIALPFQTFRVAAQLGAGASTSTATLNGSTVCMGVPMYGPFLETLGLCNPQTDEISFFAAANIAPFTPGAVDAGTGSGTTPAPSGVGTVTFANGGSAITATLTGSSLVLADHLASVLVVDASTGNPVTLGYGLDTTRTAAADGTIATVSVPTTGATLPANARVYLMIDTYPAARGMLTFP